MTKLLLITIGLGFIASLLATPLARRLSLRLGIVDHPNNGRKTHAQSTPLCGGLTLLSAFALATLGVPYLVDASSVSLTWDPSFVLPLLAAMLLIYVLGTIDDRFELRGRQKLLGQVFACAILIGNGMVIHRLQIFGWSMELGLLSIPFTMFWLLGAINALNLLDGMDGLATSVGVILSLALAGMALVTGHYADAMLAAAMAGALGGFLIYNFPPASVFLGDAGSMLIGLVLGALAIRACLKGPATIALAAPVAVWAIPILDVSMAILRRKLTGRSIYTTDRGHLHHTLSHRGLNTVTTVLLIGLLCTVTAVAAVASVYVKNEMLAIGTVAAVVVILAVGRLFGHHEFILVLKRTKQFVLSLIPLMHSRRPSSRQLETRLRGTREWSEIWQTLTTYAEQLDLCAVQLNVCLPGADEDYHADWARNGRSVESQVWVSEIPLMADKLVVGRLRVSGHCRNGSSCAWVGDLITGLKPFEMEMMALIDDTIGSTDRCDRDENTDRANHTATSEASPACGADKPPIGPPMA